VEGIKQTLFSFMQKNAHIWENFSGFFHSFLHKKRYIMHAEKNSLVFKGNLIFDLHRKSER